MVHKARMKTFSGMLCCASFRNWRRNFPHIVRKMGGCWMGSLWDVWRYFVEIINELAGAVKLKIFPSREEALDRIVQE